MVNRNDVVVVGGINAGERLTYLLHEKDNSFKIETFFKKSFFT